MFHYYGRKKAKLRYYPPPKYNTIIEPFAGSASYSMYYHHLNVTLCEKNEVIYNIWDYIINKATPRRILSFPILEIGESINLEKHNWLKQVEKDLIGFFLNAASSNPGRRPSPCKGYNRWNEKSRLQLSIDIKKVKHWKIYKNTYENLKNLKATWFIDPPYQGNGGKTYKHGNKDIDYTELKKWCLDRKGEIIVCENEEGKWMKFKKLYDQQQSHCIHTEMIYHRL